MVLNDSRSTAIVIGANGGLGRALSKQWKEDKEIDQVIAVSRHTDELVMIDGLAGIHPIRCDYTKESISEAIREIKQVSGVIKRVCICNGILHNDHIQPEKRIEDLDADVLMEVFNVNALIPMAWLKALMPIVKGDAECVITVFSARIGSISDNRSGGWYGYRASKAALNMLLKTAAIEFSRRAKNVKLIAFQPGTTDTALSKPFKASIEPAALFTPGFVASKLVGIMNRQTTDGELSYIDWENRSIAW